LISSFGVTRFLLSESDLYRFIVSNSLIIENEDLLKRLEKEIIVNAHIAGMEFIAVDPKHYLDDANNYVNSEFFTQNEG